MKNKICALFIFAGVVVLIGLGVLIGVDAVQFGTLWVKYAVLGCLLVIGICLNIRFKKYTNLDEARSCARRARRSVAKLKTKNEIRYVRRLTVVNQLTNAELLIEELIATRESYGLRDNLAALKEIKTSLKNDDDSNRSVLPETVASATQILDDILAELREL